MHTGLRLSQMRLEQRLSVSQPWLEPLHDLKVELSFHYQKIAETWGRVDIITLALGCLAFLSGSSDLSSGELSGGGDVWRVGLDGLNAVEWQAFAMMIVSFALWVVFLFRILGKYPLMREKTLYLFIGWVSVQVGFIISHAGTPEFPFNARLVDFASPLIGTTILVFLTYNTWQAVVQTRDLHVETQHNHPDPRKMVEAQRDHSLVAWGVVLVIWTLTIILSGWFGSHSVAFRDSSNMWIFRVMYFITGTVSVLALLHLLWYPQMMLGATGQEIESHRSREVSRKMRGEDSEELGQRGKCPSCGADSPVTRLPTGLLEVICMTEECDGVGAPGERCADCSTLFPNRITCVGCETSAPLSDHLSDDEAW
ncbi:MAG: hypothetical protein QF566_03850 [Candidatus Thalassarchaeaceae archaeon]|nr:hypothetical protein [Candidatus Thalassarchaeaceae archaeon]